MFFFPYVFSLLLWPVVLIGLAAIFIARRRRKAPHPSHDTEWYLQFALSKEDAVSQSFLLLSFFFLGVTLLAFNRDLGDPLSWRIILLVTSLAGFAGSYYLKTIYTLAFSVVGLTAWWGAEAAQWTDAANIKGAGLFAGLSFLALLLYSVGRLHEKDIRFKRFALVYLILGIIPVTGILFILSTKPGLGIMEEITKGGSITASWQMMLSLLVFLAAVIGASCYGATQKLLSVFEVVAVLILACLFGLTALLPPQTIFARTGRLYDFYAGGRALSDTGILWAFAYNIAIFLELLGLIGSGYIRRETWLINLGALFLFLLIVVKYFDWFFTFLDKSVFFIGAGILLFAVGWFMERGRRYMIANIQTHPSQNPQP